MQINAPSSLARAAAARMSLKWLPSCALAPQPKLPDDARFMPPLNDVRSRLRGAINMVLARFVCHQVLPDENESFADAEQE